MLELAYIPVTGGSEPLLPQSAYEVIMPFFMAVVSSAFVAPFFALLLRLTLSVVGEQPVAYGKAMGVGYFTSLTLSSLMIMCSWLGPGKMIWPVLAIAALTGVYSVMLNVRPQRALLLTLIQGAATLALVFLIGVAVRMS